MSHLLPYEKSDHHNLLFFESFSPTYNFWYFSFERFSGYSREKAARFLLGENQHFLNNPQNNIVLEISFPVYIGLAKKVIRTNLGSRETKPMRP